MLDSISGEETTPKKAIAEHLKFNWRSAKNIVDFNNRLYDFMSQNLSDEHQKIFGENAIQGAQSKLDGRVKVHLLENSVKTVFYEETSQKMQQDMQRMQQELQTREFTATVGGGAVRATAYGSKVIKSIEIDPACVDPDDVEMLQDLVLSAVNEAMRMAEEATNSEVSKLTGGMGLGF